MDVIIGTEGGERLDADGALRVEGLGGDDTIVARRTNQVNAGEGDDVVTIVDPAPLAGAPRASAGVALLGGADRVTVSDFRAGLELFEISPGVPLVDTGADVIEIRRSALDTVAPGLTRTITVAGVDGARDRIVFPDVAPGEVTVSQRTDLPGSSFPATVVRFGATEVVLTQFAFDDLSQTLAFAGGGSGGGSGGGAGNTPPVAMDDAFEVRTFLVELDPIANDTDPDGDTIEIVSVGEPLNGRAFFVPGVDTEVRYQPHGQEGIDRFEYVIEDARGARSTATVEIAITDGEGLDFEAAKRIALLYEAALDRDGAIDAGGLNFWIDAREDGLSEEEAAFQFLESPEFQASFGVVGNLGDRALVELFYQNVLGRPGEAAGVDFWTNAVGAPDYSRARLLLDFAVSQENADQLAFLDTLTEVESGTWLFVD